MNTASEVCNDEQRREKVRGFGLSGLDYVEVSEDQLTLSVYFLGKAPEGLETPNVIIEGGRRVHNIQVLYVQIYRERDPDLDDWMDVTVDKAGDFSTYTLRLVTPGYNAQGQLVYGQFPGVDLRYSRLDFSFKASCPSDLDCQTSQVCPPTPVVEPEINYLAKDYESFRQLILDRLALTIPNWQEVHIPDIGIALVEILAYVGDYLSYYQDAVSTEAYLGTARQRISVRRHVRLVDYQIHEGCNARTWLYLKTREDQTDGKLLPTDIYFISGGSGGVLQDSAVQQLPRGTYQVFEPLVENPAQPLKLYRAHNKIDFYTWGDRECCLPRGATSATLQDYTDDNPGPVLNLKVGDFLLFEEVKGTKSGKTPDADPTHRWVVRLTSVKRTRDELYDRNVLEIVWGKEDALPFPLCLSAIGSAPACELIENISVARGNILLVDNGQTICEDLSCVPVAETNPYCDECERQAADVQVSAGPYNPALKQSPLTYSQPLPAGAPASQLLTQNPRQARPQITLGSKPPDPDVELTPDTPCPDPSPIDCCDDQKPPTYWLPRYDLLESGSEDRNFVVEIDNNGIAHLRFGDDELGRAPDPLESFCARYRVGNGSSGNVGAETITTVVLKNNKNDGLTCRNPLAATGGTDPEPISEIKLFAPGAFAADQERAITADDYARLAALYPGVQRAAASLRWTGMNYEALVAVDPFGTDAIQHTLLRKIEHYLQPYRRIGHDVKVVQAQYVPIALAMTICVLPNYLQAHVKAALLAAFSNGILPDGTRGFFHPDNLSFGDSIPVSVVVAAAQAVPGVQSVTVTTLERYGEASPAALDLGVLLIGPMEIAQLDNDPNNPERGTLTLNMRGGR
jgi:Baseplate J-like protein